MIKQILVPTDFSISSENALEVAAAIAKHHDAEIILPHTVGRADDLATRSEQHEVFNASYFMRYAEQRFNRLMEKEYLQCVQITDTEHNYVNFSEINTVSREVRAHLIVMGSHGATGLKEVFVGSNTEKVVRTSDVPVLVIKHQTTNFTPKLGVFACDFQSAA